MYESRWLSLKGFFAGVELLNREARLSLTGLLEVKNLSIKFFHQNVIIHSDFRQKKLT
jgi:hypothetical protein